MIKSSNEYKKAVAEANKRYGEKSNAYRSMYISRVYNELGGKYAESKSDDLRKWRMERWVDVLEFLNGNIKACGSRGASGACRPSVRVDDATPSTIQELMNKYTKREIREFATKKSQNMNLRANWDKLSFD